MVAVKKVIFRLKDLVFILQENLKTYNKAKIFMPGSSEHRKQGLDKNTGLIYLWGLKVKPGKEKE